MGKLIIRGLSDKGQEQLNSLVKIRGDINLKLEQMVDIVGKMTPEDKHLICMENKEWSDTIVTLDKIANNQLSIEFFDRMSQGAKKIANTLPVHKQEQSVSEGLPFVRRDKKTNDIVIKNLKPEQIKREDMEVGWDENNNFLDVKQQTNRLKKIEAEKSKPVDVTYIKSDEGKALGKLDNDKQLLFFSGSLLARGITKAEFQELVEKVKFI